MAVVEAPYFPRLRESKAVIVHKRGGSTPLELRYGHSIKGTCLACELLRLADPGAWCGTDCQSLAASEDREAMELEPGSLRGGGFSQFCQSPK